MNQNLKALLEFEEGKEQKPYKCKTGHWTIGIGHKIKASDVETWNHLGGMTDKHISDTLDQDIGDATKAAKKYIWFDRMDEARQAVIISMIFQMGAIGFAKFEKTIKLLSKGQYEAAADQMEMSLWAKQTPNRAKRHAEQMRTGEW